MVDSGGDNKDEVGACVRAGEAVDTCTEEHLLLNLGDALAVEEEEAVVGMHSLPLPVSVDTADELEGAAHTEEADGETKWLGCTDHLATESVEEAAEMVEFP